MNKVLIIGARGILGHDLVAVFKKHHPVAWDIEDVDLAQKRQIFSKIKKLKPTVVINAAGYTDVDRAEKNSDLAKMINGIALDYLSQICQELNAVLIHFSTDYIFSGHNKNGYREKYFDYHPVNAYGRSKLLGELAIKKWGAKGLKYYLIRTSWLFGPKTNAHQHKNFVDTIIKLASANDQIKVVNDQTGCPTYSLDLARAVENLLTKKYPFGIYHLINSGLVTWYQFAKQIVQTAKLNLKISPCLSKDFPRPAQRPKYSILLNTKYPPLRSWKAALEDYLKS